MSDHEAREEEQPDLDKIWALLRSLDRKIDSHLQEEAAYKPRLLELVTMMERSKGAIMFIKYSALITAAAISAYTWFSSHFNLIKG